MQRSEFKTSCLPGTLTFPVSETYDGEQCVQMNANTPDTTLSFAVAGNSASEEKMVVALHKGLLFSLPSA